jgi:secreted PhoX family phosphatase
MDTQGKRETTWRNAMNDVEFTRPTFSPSGQTSFANIQERPAITLATWGPW